MKIKFIIFACLIGFFFANVGQIVACSCVKYKPQEVYNLADIVFIGRVIEGLTKVKEEKNHYSAVSDITTFEVTEAFVGVQKGEKVKFAFGDSGYCSFSIPFFTNYEYVIYAQKNEKKNLYETNYCLRSKMTDVSINEQREYEGFLRSELKEDLQFLRQLLPLKTKVTLRGRVVQKVYENSIANVKITIKDKNNPQKVIFTKSDEDGNFILDLPEGEYKVEVEVPKDRILTKWTKEE